MILPMKHSGGKRKGVYILCDTHQNILHYVGLSVNRLADRWRSSPAFDSDLNSLGRNELFHSQCWSNICDAYPPHSPSHCSVSVLHGGELLKVLSELGHPLSCFSHFVEVPEMVVIALAAWFIKRFNSQIWNKRIV